MPIQRLLYLLMVLAAANSSRAFSQPSAVSAVPANPETLMRLSAAQNGLDAPATKPWHIRGHYIIYDHNGQQTDQGVYEEWWAAADRYRRSFSSAHFTQTDYATAKGLFREGAQAWPDTESTIRSALVEPVPELPKSEFMLEKQRVSAQGTSLNCIFITYALRLRFPEPISNSYFPHYCFEAAMPILRSASAGGSDQKIYNQIVKFQGRYVATEIHGISNGKPSFDFFADVVEDLHAEANPFPDPPQAATPVNLDTISLPTSFQDLRIVNRSMPWYPNAAKLEHIEGEVVLNATIGKNGRVENLTEIDGSPALWPSARNAVDKWLYRPFLVMGEPRRVETVVQVVFSLSSSPYSPLNTQKFPGSCGPVTKIPCKQ